MRTYRPKREKFIKKVKWKFEDYDYNELFLGSIISSVIIALIFDPLFDLNGLLVSSHFLLIIFLCYIKKVKRIVWWQKIK